MNTNFVIHGAVALMMAFHFFFGAIVVERMAGAEFQGHAAFFVYRMVSLVVLASVAAWLAFTRRDFQIPAFGWLLAAMLPLGMIAGLNQGHSIGQMPSHVVQALTALVGFYCGHLFFKHGLNLWAVLRISSYAGLAIVIFWLAIYAVSVWMSGVNIPHYSLNFYILVIPLAYFAACRKGNWALFTFALMVLIGKRAIMLAGIAGMAWCYIAVLRFDKERLGQTITTWQWSAFGVVACVPLLWSLGGRLLTTVQSDAVPPVLTGGADRFTNIADLNALSSFRGDLITSVVGMLNSAPLQWWTGAGFGSSFIFAYNDNAGVTYGVDLMPLHLVMLYGVPATLVIMTFVAWVILRGWVVVHRGHGEPRQRLMTALIAVLIGYVACSMFTYVSIDPTFWFFLGAVSFLLKKSTSDKNSETMKAVTSKAV